MTHTHSHKIETIAATLPLVDRLYVNRIMTVLILLRCVLEQTLLLCQVFYLKLVAMMIKWSEQTADNV